MKSLIGDWISDPEFTSNQKTQMEFTEDGHLIYTIMGKEKDDIMFLTYRVENDMIVTNQPSHPKEERTKFSFTPDGKLILIYGSDKHTYVRLIK